MRGAMRHMRSRREPVSPSMSPLSGIRVATTSIRDRVGGGNARSRRRGPCACAPGREQGRAGDARPGGGQGARAGNNPTRHVPRRGTIREGPGPERTRHAARWTSPPPPHPPLLPYTTLFRSAPFSNRRIISPPSAIILLILF